MDRFDVVLILVSCGSLYVWYRYGTHITLNSGSLTSCHVRARCCCASYESTGSQLCMHPVCHSDGLFVSTGHETPSIVPTNASTPIAPYLCTCVYFV